MAQTNPCEARSKTLGSPSEDVTEPYLNGSGGNSVINEAEDHALIALLKNIVPIVLAIGLGVIGSLAAAGFIGRPATTAALDELKESFLAYVKHHNELDETREKAITFQLNEISSSLRIISERSHQTELSLAEIKGALGFKQPILPQASPSLSLEDPEPTTPARKPKPKAPAVLPDKKR